MKRSEAIALVAEVQAAWPQREFGPSTIKRYVDSIEHLEREAVAAAIEELVVTSKFVPSIAEITQAAHNAIPGDRAPEADNAWSEVLEQIRTVGSKRGMMNYATGEDWEPQWSHPAIGQAAEALGWDQLCSSENLMADRAHFIKFYQGAIERTSRQRAITPRGHQLTAALADKLAIGRGL